VTIKSQVTIRRDMWERLNNYMDNPKQARKVIREALRRFWLELKERGQAGAAKNAINDELAFAIAKIVLAHQWQKPEPPQPPNRWN
jgi:hypothetical protein